ncbi:MAG: hypothetical protein AAFR53_01670 [Pseudomonadota bacterium]
MITVAALAGCDGMPAFSFAPLNPEGEEGQLATQEVRLTDGMIVRAPFGKCIDLARTRQEEGSATVVMANCSNLGAAGSVGAREASLLLVTILPGGHGDLGDVSEAIQSEPGILARSGRSEDIELVSVETTQRALYANVVDLSAGGPEGVSARHWKAAFDVSGRAVILSIFGKEDGELTGVAGGRLARDAAQTLLDANVATPPPLTALIEDVAIDQAPQSTESDGGLFDRLLGRR